MTKFILAVLLLLTTAASAHEWYPESCCGGIDCHPTPCGRLKQYENGFVYEDRWYFDQSQIHVSQDDSCHICTSGNSSWAYDFRRGRCFFEPMVGY